MVFTLLQNALCALQGNLSAAHDQLDSHCCFHCLLCVSDLPVGETASVWCMCLLHAMQAFLASLAGWCLWVRALWRVKAQSRL